MFLVFGASSNNATVHDVLMATSTDNGRTWSRPTVIFSTSTSMPASVSGGLA